MISAKVSAPLPSLVLSYHKKLSSVLVVLSPKNKSRHTKHDNSYSTPVTAGRSTVINCAFHTFFNSQSINSIVPVPIFFLPRLRLISSKYINFTGGA